ncbi:MAG: hypothetical protein KKH33_21720 [Alphaproteobacteria bacterium]|nr:hypothetical protein [Alphaproteobacteria bacterium]
MLKIFWKQATATAKARADWRHDPLGHPALQEMSLLELADLPMVAEVQMRQGRAEVVEDCRLSASHGHRAGCSVSR